MKKKISRKIEGEKSISLLAIDLINSEMCRFHEISAYITIKDVNGKIYSMHCHNSTRIKYELETLYNKKNRQYIYRNNN